MAYYLVTAEPDEDKLAALKLELEGGKVEKLEPYGKSLHKSLSNARRLPDGKAVWEELDYCSPPLAQERAAVLDRFFDNITVKEVSGKSGWAAIADLPPLFPDLSVPDVRSL